MTDPTSKAAETRAAILRRRAVFVSSALTALSGCQPQSGDDKPPVNPSGATSAIPAGSAAGSASATASEAPTATATATAAATASASGSASVPMDMPSLEIPAGINDIAKRAYEHLVQESPRLANMINTQIANLPASCDFSKPAWATVARTLGTIERDKDRLGPRCLGSGKSADAKGFITRFQEHTTYLDGRIAVLNERVAAALKPGGKAAEEAFEQLRKQARMPQVCLRFRCDDW